MFHVDRYNTPVTSSFVPTQDHNLHIKRHTFKTLRHPHCLPFFPHLLPGTLVTVVIHIHTIV
ncbi:hypothetical protein DM02DRAFT_415276 [Periconia macrospinosa]|uniref:Uncharacterized protein n=1 Tax=Periconia macrospinosa TaxID=97972 RepID=A0A2V1DP28_9PLEO|nr:hypothetical protein DM02DRAFT_415276 [Periconia macrospinosa]